MDKAKAPMMNQQSPVTINEEELNNLVMEAMRNGFAYKRSTKQLEEIGNSLETNILGILKDCAGYKGRIKIRINSKEKEDIFIIDGEKEAIYYSQYHEELEGYVDYAIRTEEDYRDCSRLQLISFIENSVRIVQGMSDSLAKFHEENLKVIESNPFEKLGIKPKDENE